MLRQYFQTTQPDDFSTKLSTLEVVRPKSLELLFLCALLYNGPIPTELLLNLKIGTKNKFGLSDLNYLIPVWLEKDGDSYVRLSQDKRLQIRSFLENFVNQVPESGKKLSSDYVTLLELVIMKMVISLTSDKWHDVCDKFCDHAQYLLVFAEKFANNKTLKSQLESALEHYNLVRVNAGFTAIDPLRPNNPPSPAIFSPANSEESAAAEGPSDSQHHLAQDPAPALAAETPTNHPAHEAEPAAASVPKQKVKKNKASSQSMSYVKVGLFGLVAGFAAGAVSYAFMKNKIDDSGIADSITNIKLPNFKLK